MPPPSRPALKLDPYSVIIRENWLETVRKANERFTMHIPLNPLAWVPTKGDNVAGSPDPSESEETDVLCYIRDGSLVQPRKVGSDRLSAIEIVIVVDDSLSMNEGHLWEQAREALAGIVDIANQYGSKGSDIHFMHQVEYGSNMQSRTEVQTLFNRILPEGEDTPTGAKLGQIINHYLPFLERPNSTHEPIAVVVITDGLPTDQANLERVIVDAAHRLDHHNIKEYMFSIQFVQIGTDPAASELFHVLDDHLVNRYKIRDMVGSTPFDPEQGAFDTKYLLKILLRGLHQDQQSVTNESLSIESVELSKELKESDISGRTTNMVANQLARESELKRLVETKVVMVVDDTLSMNENGLWEQAREALAGIVDIANQYGSKGSDIHFMHLDDYAPSIQSRTEVQTLFNRILPEGEDTPTGAKLAQIIDHYLPLIERPNSTHEPIAVVVITGGLPTDQADLEREIVHAAHRLDRHNIKHDMFGIQFVQIGTDPAASELLRKLDDQLVNRYRIRDIVDSTPFDPAQGAFDTEYILKILLGGLPDRVGSSSGASPGPPVQSDRPAVSLPSRQRRLALVQSPPGSDTELRCDK